MEPELLARNSVTRSNRIWASDKITDWLTDRIWVLIPSICPKALRKINESTNKTPDDNYWSSVQPTWVIREIASHSSNTHFQLQRLQLWQQQVHKIHCKNNLTTFIKRIATFIKISNLLHLVSRCERDMRALCQIICYSWNNLQHKSEWLFV